ncbi:MAG: Phosphoribosylglycinamide synthetase, domain, partial [Patescibacteria group bacterium]|nr:Phosphoribosylglycinamide synthetase, domain [Patescibacteria group bacterium]
MAEVLIVGATGGREAALEQAIKLSKHVTKVVVSKDLENGLKHFKSSKNKPFIVIGPEQSLVNG